MTGSKFESKDRSWRVSLLDHFMGNWAVRATERFATVCLAMDWATLHISVRDIGEVYVEHETAGN